MKIETVNRRQATSAVGAGWSAGTATPDSTANLTKNCIVVVKSVVPQRPANRPAQNNQGTASKPTVIGETKKTVVSFGTSISQLELA